MSPENKNEFAKILKSTFEVYGQPLPSQDVIRIWWSALLSFDIADARSALDEHIRTNKFIPRPADIISIIDRANPDGRLGADEAWAMMPRDEYASVVMTTEMADALRIAQPLLDEGDQVAARMAFKESYNRACENNKRSGISPVWFASLGWDQQGRERVMREAVSLGRITEKQLLSIGFSSDKEPKKIAEVDLKKLVDKMIA